MNYSLINTALFGIGILIANVPEGLLGSMTITLALTAQALSKKHVLVKNLGIHIKQPFSINIFK